MKPGRRSGIRGLLAVGVLMLGACGTEASPGEGGANPSMGALSRSSTRAVVTQPTMPDGALTCPATITDREGMTVPHPPGGVDGTARLLPDRPPQSLVVCAYPVLDFSASTPLSPPFALARRTVVNADQRHRLADRLTWAPRGGGPPGPCTAMGGNETAYLLGSAYGRSDPSAVVWVAAKADPNSCSPATNGDFVAGPGVGNQIEAIVAARGPHPISSPGAPCTFDSSGRLGDDRSLAPDGAPLVTVCRAGRDGQIATPLDADQSSQVVVVLRSLPTRPTSSRCSMADGAQNGQQRAFSLLLHYPAGPPAVVNVAPGCRPELLGSALQADDGAAVVKLVERWSKPLPYLDPNGSVSSGDHRSGAGVSPSGTPTVTTTADGPQPGAPPTAVPAPVDPGGGVSGILPTPPRLPGRTASTSSTASSPSR